MTKKTYTVTGMLAATTQQQEVEASSFEEALDKAFDLDMNPSLCHYCSKEVTLDTECSYEVEDENGNTQRDGDLFSYERHLTDLVTSQREIIKQYKEKFGDL